MAESVFAQEAQRYDDWYDSPEGGPLYRAELETLEPMVGGSPGPGIEIGVGSGRFAGPLGVKYGVDPVIEPLRIARTRGVQSVVGLGEDLPFSHGAFDMTLFVFTLCFVQDPVAAMREAARVTSGGGKLILGVIPADGPLGRHYQELADAGHRIYRTAHFYTRQDLYELLEGAGLEAIEIRSAQMQVVNGTIKPGAIGDSDHPEAGFLAISARHN